MLKKKVVLSLAVMVMFSGPLCAMDVTPPPPVGKNVAKLTAAELKALEDTKQAKAEEAALAETKRAKAQAKDDAETLARIKARAKERAAAKEKADLEAINQAQAEAEKAEEEEAASKRMLERTKAAEAMNRAARKVKAEAEADAAAKKAAEAKAKAERDAVQRDEFTHGLNLNLEEQAELSKILADASDSKKVAEIAQDIRELMDSDKVVKEYESEKGPRTAAEKLALKRAMKDSDRAKAQLVELLSSDSDENGSDDGSTTSSVEGDRQALIESAQQACMQAAKTMFNQNIDDETRLKNFANTVLNTKEFASLGVQDKEFLKGYFLECVWRLQAGSVKNASGKVAKIVLVVKYISQVVSNQAVA